MDNSIAKIIQLGGKLKQKIVPTTAYEITKKEKREYCEKNNLKISDADWWQIIQNLAFKYLKENKGGK